MNCLFCKFKLVLNESKALLRSNIPYSLSDIYDEQYRFLKNFEFLKLGCKYPIKMNKKKIKILKKILFCPLVDGGNALNH